MNYQIAPGQFVYVESFSRWNNTAYKFTLETIENNKLKSKLEAESAVWDSTKQCWKLRNWFMNTRKKRIQLPSAATTTAFIFYPDVVPFPNTLTSGQYCF